MSGHTKGPWEMEPEETTERGHYTPPQVFSVADPDNPQIVCTLAVRNGVTELENGRLISAAPELLEALKRLVADCSDYEAWARPCLAYDKAKAAIAKAEGQ